MIVEQDEENGKPTIHLFYRNKEGKRVRDKIDDFEPYFYVDIEDGAQLTPDKERKVKRIERLDKFGLDNGKRVQKIITNSPKDVPVVSSDFQRHYEADIVFTQRYLIDAFDELPEYKYRIHYLDIETANFSSPDQATKPITCITIFDNFLGKFITVAWHPRIVESHLNLKIGDFVKTRIKELEITEELGQYFENEKIDPETEWSIHWYETEKEMLRAYIEMTRDLDPDIITGWNATNFDMLYILTRFDNLNINGSLLSPMGTSYTRQNNYGNYDIIIKGRVAFDLLLYYKKLTSMNKVKTPQHKLGVTSVFEGFGDKVDVTNDYEALWMETPNKLIYYNLVDVLRTKQIDEKRLISNFVISLHTLSKCELGQVGKATRLSDAILLDLTKNRPIVCPSKVYVQDNESFEGAKVFDPVVGLHKNVIGIDLSGLYPSIMRSWNMSYETINNDGDLVVGNGIKFTSRQKGIIIEIIEKIGNVRNKYKKKKAEAIEKYGHNSEEARLYESYQYSMKVVGNSVYGVLANPGFRLSDKRIAESITYLGREIVSWTKDKAEELAEDFSGIIEIQALDKEILEILKKEGIKFLYGDTDSNYLSLPESLSKEQMVSLGKAIDSYINKSYDEFAQKKGLKKHFIFIELEKMATTGLFIDAKKRYALNIFWADDKFLDKPKIHFTGFDAIRGDSSKFQKKMQREVITMLLKEVGEDAIKDYIKGEISAMERGKYDFFQLAVPGSITKPFGEYKSNHINVRAAKWSNLHLGTSFGEGSKPYRLYVEQVPRGMAETDVFAFDLETELPEGFAVDKDEIVNGIRKKLDKVLEAVDMDFDKILSNQVDMTEFF
jgi:DNA polymerase I